MIGTRLPVDKVAAGIAQPGADGLPPTTPRSTAVAEALRTTDTVTKPATSPLDLPGPDGAPVTVTVSGIAKGVGMIHPRMATMLARHPHRRGGRARRRSTALLRADRARTWNQLTVDGDTSTNDTVFLLASGASGAAPVAAGTPEAAALGGRVEAVARVARPPAGRRRRGRHHPDHLPGERRRATTPTPGPSPAPSSPAASSRPRSTAATPTGAGSPARPATPTCPTRRCSRRPACPSRGRARGPAAPAIVDPGRLRIAIAGTLVFDGPAGRSPSTAPPSARRWTRRRSSSAWTSAWAAAPARRSAAT